MMRTTTRCLAITAVSLLQMSSGATAQPQPSLPVAVRAHIQSLDTACRAAGGRPATTRYIFARDYSGDGRLDYLVSEGDYGCAGRPDLFRQNTQARVVIYVTDRTNVARSTYDDRLAAYRLIDGSPVRVQIAKRGSACAPDAARTLQCAAQLAWNGNTFTEGVRVSSADGTQVLPASPPPVPGAPTVGVSAALPLARGARDEFLARCRDKHLRASGQAAARWVDDQCREEWRHVEAAGPAADALLAAIPTSVGNRLALSDLRSRLSGIHWAARAQPPYLASGTLGELSALVEGRGGQPAALVLNWTRVGAEIPYDMVNALRARGVALTVMSCERMMAGEGTRVYAGTAPGRAPFTLTVSERSAPVANANSYYGANVSLDGRHPPRGSTAQCDF